MTTRRRSSGNDVKVPTTSAIEAPFAVPADADSKIRPSQSIKILSFSLLFFIPYFYLLLFHYQIDMDLKRSILINALLSAGGFLVTLRLIPVASRYVLRRNLFGYDINKKGTPQGSIKIPESLGIVVGIVFMVLAFVFQYFNFTEDSNWLVEYNAALASVCFMTLLGFVDDVLDVPWRVKLVLPSFAALPLLMAYAGHTTIVIPKPLVPFIGLDILDLGWVYKLYMGLLAVFCTNSINIHAGLNGLEVGQTVVIACAILIHNVMQIGASKDPEYQQAHAFSIYLVHPFLAASLALLSYNWYPSSVFVGDTYTYFAGMTMAVVGVLWITYQFNSRQAIKKAKEHIWHHSRLRNPSEPSSSVRLRRSLQPARQPKLHRLSRLPRNRPPSLRSQKRRLQVGNQDQRSSNGAQTLQWKHKEL